MSGTKAAKTHPRLGSIGPIEKGLMHGILSTGQVSKLLNVAPRTVSKWCNIGKLVHYRLPSGIVDGQGDRRVKLESLLDFLVKHGIPIPELVAKYASRGNVLVYGVDKQLPYDVIPNALQCGIYIHNAGFDKIKVAVLGDCFGTGEMMQVFDAILERNPLCRFYIVTDSSTPIAFPVKVDITLFITPPDWNKLQCDISAIVPHLQVSKTQLAPALQQISSVAQLVQ